MDRKRLAAAILLAAGAMLIGIGIGHELWRPAAPTVMRLPGEGGSGPRGSGGSSYGSGSPYGYGYGSGRGSSSGTPPGAAGGPSNVSSIAAAVDPGLVSINVAMSDQGGKAAATGIVLTPSGLVLTNNHVVDGATSLSATDVGNGKTYKATVAGYDRGADIAVIQLSGASGLKTTAIGTSAKVAVGQAVVAIGNAGGAGGTPRAAGGSVVALNQRITAAGASSGNPEQLSGLIETNADIRPGDSGGPLVNGSGQVIGVVTAASAGHPFRSTSGRGYAIPIDQAAAIAAQIKAGHSSSNVHIGPTAFLGVELSSATSRASVVGVLPASPAAKAGLSAGDTITSLAGRAVDSPTTLLSLLGHHRPGDKVRLSWTDSSGRRHTATVRLAVGPAH